MNAKMERLIQRGKRSGMFFYIGVLIIPMIQFCIFYIVLNANVFILAFKEYELDGSYTWAGFQNFKQVFVDIFTAPNLAKTIPNSVKCFTITFFIGTPLGLFMSFYMYKKMPFSGLFKVVMFLPSVVSSIIMVLIFKYVTEDAIPSLFGLEMGLLTNIDTAYNTLVGYSLWSGFGSTIMMYLGALGKISPEQTEAMELDGANSWHEFWHLAIPYCYPLLTIGLMSVVSNFFMSSPPLYAFYQNSADPKLWTLGYYFQITILSNKDSVASYPYTSAAGLLITFIFLPITMATKALLDKFDPEATE